ncbi:MAG: alpha/beta hydrolase [Clostridia bacterium]|nr:alpha/beta hydrolase [Clostridia bacterium]
MIDFGLLWLLAAAIIFLVIAAVVAIILVAAALTGGAYYVYRKVFFSDRTKKKSAYHGIDKRGFAPYTERVRALIDEISRIPYEDVYITARDGIRLRARYYHVSDAAPVEIQFHGYRDNPYRDMAGSALCCLKDGNNLLLVDQRGGGESGGKVITFGILERYDVIAWTHYVARRFGEDKKILLFGISMGAASVLMASGEDLPRSVRGAVADCPYSSPIEIIGIVGAKKGVPAFLARLFAIIGARLFGGFSILESNAVAAVKKSSVPILLIHGDSDSLVPFYMSEEISAASQNVTFERFCAAEHATSYLSDSERYFSVLESFKNTVLKG